MAYFSNSSEGDCFYEQCAICKYGAEPCPIAFIQMEYNYSACNNEIATKILSSLVEDDGTCTMFKEFRKDFEIDKTQLKINFDETP